MLRENVLLKKVLASVLGVGFVLTATNVYAAEAEKDKLETHQLERIVVEGSRLVVPGGFLEKSDRVGILGNIDAVDVPFTQKKYTEKTIETFADPNQPLNGVLANNPSIRLGTTSPMYTDFSMRGINMNASHYYLNGIPNLFNQTRSLPTWVLDSVEVVSGPNTVLNGATNSNNGTNGTDAPPGMLSATTKKAEMDNITRYTQSFSGRGTMTEMIDVGRRFGENKEWGLRVNGRWNEGKMSMKGADIEEKTLYLNLDHQDERSTTNLFAGYYDFEVQGGQRWLSASNVTKGNLAEAPDNANDLSFEGQRKFNRGYLATLNHEQKLNEAWTAFFNMGTGQYNEEKYDPQSGSLTLSNNGILKQDLRNYKSQSINTYLQAGVRGEQKWGEVSNNLSLSIDRGYTKSRSSSVKSTGAISGNIWDGVIVSGKFPVAASLDTIPSSYETVTSVTIADRMQYGKWSAYLSGQFRDGKYETSTQNISKNSFNPTYALAYKPEKNMSVYASHSESYTRPVLVGAGYDNKGEIFEPIKNKQNEIGFKLEAGKLLHTVAVFEMNQGVYINEDSTGPEGKIYSQDGENKFKGLEYSLTGKLTDKWNVMGGFMYLNAKREKNAKGSEYKDGWRSNGVPKWNAVLAAEYEADENLSLIGRINYTGSALVNDNAVEAPAYVTLDLGAKYKTKINNTPVTLRAMCYNLTGKDYWISRGTSVCLGTPRTFMLSAQFDL